MDLRDRLRDHLCRQEGLAAAWLFGSVARGVDSPRSDVDVIVMNQAPVDLIHRVLRDGELLFEGNRSCRVAFTVKARNEYFDLLPHLRRYRKRAVDKALGAS